MNLHLGRFCRRFIPKIVDSSSDKVHLSEERETINRCRYSKDVHRYKCQALTITRLSHSLYKTKIARIRCYTMLCTIFKIQDVQHTQMFHIRPDSMCLPSQGDPTEGCRSGGPVRTVPHPGCAGGKLVWPCMQSVELRGNYTSAPRAGCSASETPESVLPKCTQKSLIH